MSFFGKKIIIFIEGIFAPLKILPLTIRALIREKKSKKNSYWQIFINDVYYSGVSAIPIITVLGFSVGFLVILLFPFDKISFGIKNIYGSVYSTFILRELAPLLTALVVLVRSTLSITIELSQMKIDGEIETLEIMGINPIQYLGSIKIFAGLISLPVLSIYFSLSSVISGALSTFLFYKILPQDYFLEVIDTIRIRDLFIFLLRTMVSGFLIFIIAIYNGLSAQRDITMIKLRTIRAITTAVFVIIIINFLITVSIYGK